MNSINKDIMVHIMDHLNYIDIIAMMHTNKYIASMINIDTNFVKAYIEKTLIKFGLSYQNFIYRIGETGILFGGMMLGIVTGNIHKSSDFDIIHAIKNNDIYSPIQSISLNRGRENNHVRENIYSENGYKGCMGEIAYPFGLIMTDGSSSDGRIYQHLNLLYSTQSLCKYIDNHCDYECTKIFYDGDKIYIKNYLTAITKKINVNFSQLFRKKFKNILRFNKNIWRNDLYEYVVDTIFSRIKKYQQKNYDVRIIGNDFDLRIDNYFKKIIANNDLIILTAYQKPMMINLNSTRHWMCHTNYCFFINKAYNKNNTIQTHFLRKYKMDLVYNFNEYVDDYIAKTRQKFAYDKKMIKLFGTKTISF